MNFKVINLDLRNLRLALPMNLRNIKMWATEKEEWELTFLQNQGLFQVFNNYSMESNQSMMINSKIYNKKHFLFLK
jgi:hypothetical protein